MVKKDMLQKEISRKYLLFIAFISGFSIMAIELTASRLLDPYFGSSLFVWTNVIGLMMVFLSLGYFFGGKLADRNPDPIIIFKIIFIAGIAIFFTPFLVKPIVSFTTIEAIIENHASIVVLMGSFLTTLILFILPISLLGMVSPFIIKILITRDQKEEGTKSGLVFTFSTIGSILGTFLSSLVAIPFVGTNNTIFIASLILIFFTTPFIFEKKWLVILIDLFFVFFIGIWILYQQTIKDDNLILDDESVYHHITIEKIGDFSYLHLINNKSYSSIYKPNIKFSDSYFDYFSTLPYVESEKKDKKVLILGLAGGTMVHQYNNLLGKEFNFQIDGIELDGKLISIARKYFDLNFSNLKIHNIDGRMFLRQNKNKYDIIIIDAFSRQLYIPHHLSTKEFFSEISSHFTESGVLAINVVAFSDESKLLKTVTNTLASQFKYVYVASSEHSYNFFVVASKKEINFSLLYDKIKDEELKKTALFIEDSVERVPFNSKELVLLDDRAPIEFLTDQTAFKYFIDTVN